MADISTFPQVRNVLVAGSNVQTFIAGATIKAAQIVAFHATGVSNTLHPAVRGVTAMIAGVALYDAAVGALVAVACRGCEAKVVNADDTTAIDAGSPIGDDYNAIGGTASAIEGTVYTAGQTKQDIPGGGTGVINVAPGSTLGATGRGAIVIAANDSSELDKQQADYVCTGTADQATIQTAIDAVELGTGANPQHHGKSGAVIRFKPGKFSFNGLLTIDKNIFLEGSGFTATEFVLADNSDCGMIWFTNFQAGSDVSYGAGVSHLRLDGNVGNQAGDWWDLYGLSLAVSDAYFDHLWIDACGTGLRSNSMWSTYFNQISIEQCTQGAYFNASADNRFEFLQFNGLNVHQKFEIRAYSTNSYARDIVIRDSNFGAGTHSYDSLELEGNVYDSVINSCRFRGEPAAGYYDIKMLDGTPGDPENISISDCRFPATGGAGNIYLPTASDLITIRNNKFWHATPVVLQAGANANGKVMQNYGFVTENSGTATLLSAGTSIVVTHGLRSTPVAGDITITPLATWGNMTKFWVDTYTATQFTIHADIAPGADTLFGWKAEKL